MPAIKISKQYNLISALLAFCIWGGWSFYINDNSLLIRVSSGLAQGISSFIITLIMVNFVTWLYNKNYFSPLRLILPAIITVIATGSALIVIHYLVGTPNIFVTVLPALIVGFLFCIYTSYKLMFK